MLRVWPMWQRKVDVWLLVAGVLFLLSKCSSFRLFKDLWLENKKLRETRQVRKTDVMRWPVVIDDEIAIAWWNDDDINELRARCVRARDTNKWQYCFVLLKFKIGSQALRSSCASRTLVKKHDRWHTRAQRCGNHMRNIMADGLHCHLTAHKK